ncbi:MAG: thiamine pyrophosphate-dependent dehydrogenase E1 component subunit alpha [Solirubrobacterales bacterium]|nr:thiamine pyrophosphate-dependent dehydrogenase E1 component subunit alpha [Solirubrobacterales bacterium]
MSGTDRLVVETPGLPREEGTALLERMLLIRRFEDAVQRLFQRGEVHGTTHLYSGQEAGAVGVCAALRPDDRVAGTYRGHGHALALGVDPQRLMDELLGRASGVCGGRAGSMNVVDLEHGLIGCFGIVGGSIAAATGVALAFQRRGTGHVAVAFFGEGTSNQAYFAECLNFAQVLRLPAVFVCENNRYMEFTPIEDVTAGDIPARVEALGLWNRTVDGMDVQAVRAGAEEAVAYARAGEGPAFLQTLTYRFVGHSRSDPGAYRKAGELDEMRRRDPLTIERGRLIEHGLADEAELDALADRVARRVDEVVERALAAPFPTADAELREYAG